jgi:hypothetical protein
VYDQEDDQETSNYTAAPQASPFKVLDLRLPRRYASSLLQPLLTRFEACHLLACW